MAFYEKMGDKLVRKLQFPGGTFSMDIHKTSDWRWWRLRMDYPTENYYFADIFKTQREAKEFGIAFSHWFDAGMAVGTEEIKNLRKENRNNERKN